MANADLTVLDPSGRAAGLAGDPGRSFGGLAKTGRKSRQSRKTKGLTFISAMPPGCVATATPGAAGVKTAIRPLSKPRARHRMRSIPSDLSMRQPQNDAGEIISFFEKPPLEYAA